jgi:hypothetical protein
MFEFQQTTIYQVEDIMIWLTTKILPTKDNLQLDQPMNFAFKIVMNLSELAFTKSRKPIQVPKYLVPFPLGI